ncbi:MAG: DUF2442 domain-containing protein [Synergistaceae bacterium]|nr:DUF2442 domain-containing protein [Synergistaceae bacterium]
MIHGEEEMLPRVSSVEARPDYSLVVTFRNGERRLYNAESLLKLPMYRNLAKVFMLARAEYGAVIWPGDMDISPDTLYMNSTVIDG